MQGDNVELGLITDTDLFALVRSGPSLGDELLIGVDEVGTTIHDATGARVGAIEEANIGVRGEGGHFLSLMGGPGIEDMDPTPEERALLSRLGTTAFFYGLEGTSYDLARRAICTLSAHCRLSVFNDWDRVVSAAAFCAMSFEEQVAFMGAKHDAQAPQDTSVVAE